MGRSVPRHPHRFVIERTSDGPGSYGAELNVQGKVVDGHVWTTRGLSAGEYRLTVSLDQPPTFTPGVSIAPDGR